MKSINTFFYQLGQGIISIYRNRVMSIASVLALVSCMLIIGTFYLIIDNISFALNNTDDINYIKIIIPDELTDEQEAVVKTKADNLKKELNNVKNVQQFTKSQNLEKYKQSSNLDKSILDLYTEENNPLPASIEIEFIGFADPDFDMDLVYSLKAKIDDIENIDADDIKDNLGLYEKVNSVVDTLKKVALCMMVILLLVALFVIMNTIRLGMYARQNEIKFMRYVGATKGFIRTPFIIEGIIIGLLSAGIAFGLQYLIYNFLISNIVESKTAIDSISMFKLIPFNDYLSLLICGFVGVGLLTGIISSTISIYKYLKV